MLNVHRAHAVTRARRRARSSVRRARDSTPGCARAWMRCVRRMSAASSETPCVVRCRAARRRGKGGEGELGGLRIEGARRRRLRFPSGVLRQSWRRCGAGRAQSRRRCGAGWAQSRRRCGRGEPSPGSNVEAASTATFKANGFRILGLSGNTRLASGVQICVEWSSQLIAELLGVDALPLKGQVRSPRPAPSAFSDGLLRRIRSVGLFAVCCGPPRRSSVSVRTHVRVRWRRASGCAERCTSVRFFCAATHTHPHTPVCVRVCARVCVRCGHGSTLPFCRRRMMRPRRSSLCSSRR